MIADAVIARDPGLLIAGSITRNADGIVTSANVVWPDGATGTFTATQISTFGTDAYTITKGAVTFTQPAVTRDTQGAVTNRPQITVA